MYFTLKFVNVIMALEEKFEYHQSQKDSFHWKYKYQFMGMQTKITESLCHYSSFPILGYFYFCPLCVRKQNHCHLDTDALLPHIA